MPGLPPMQCPRPLRAQALRGSCWGLGHLALRAQPPSIPGMNAGASRRFLVMLAMGMAGEPETEVYTRAGVLFWLLHYAAMHLAVLRGRSHHTPQTAWHWGISPAGVALLGLGVLGLVWS